MMDEAATVEDPWTEAMEQSEQVYAEQTLALPEEIMLKVFSYLDHGDRLIARRVCREWNTFLTSSIDFINSVTYTISGKDLEQMLSSYTVLSASAVRWKSLKIQDCPNFNIIQPLPDYLDDSLTSLSFHQSELQLSWIREAAARFSGLEELTVAKLEKVGDVTVGSKNLDLNSPQVGQEAEKFEKFKKRLKTLKLSTVVANTDGSQIISHILGELQGANGLKEFELELGLGPRCLPFYTDFVDFMNGMVEYEADERVEGFGKMLLNFLDLTAPSLKSLTMLIPGWLDIVPFVQHVELGQKMELENLTLSWTGISRQSIDPIHNSFINFIQTQPNLRSLYLPTLRLSDSDAEKLLSFLPKRLEKITIEDSGLLKPAFMPILADVKDLTIRIPCVDGLQAVRSTVLRNVTSLTVLRGGKDIMDTIVDMFPNLTKLNFDSTWKPLVQAFSSPPRVTNDEALQTIIRTWPALEVLSFTSTVPITDFGISGILPADAEHLRISEIVYLEPDFSKVRVRRAGLPLSELKHLRELTLECLYTEIGDVGIGYGIRFPYLRKLGVCCFDEKMSPWGWAALHLAELNPKLEFFTMKTEEPIPISPEALIFLHKILPRISPRTLSLQTVRRLKQDTK